MPISDYVYVPNNSCLNTQKKTRIQTPESFSFETFMSDPFEVSKPTQSKHQEGL